MCALTAVFSTPNYEEFARIISVGSLCWNTTETESDVMDVTTTTGPLSDTWISILIYKNKI